MSRKQHGLSHVLEQFSAAVTRAAGGSIAFTVACLVVLVWAASGPVFRFSNTWQLVINTGTTIVTFLMVFLLQRAQNKDALAIQLKLNELIAALDGASARLINVEDLDEDELKLLHAFYQRLSSMARKESRLTESHSVEEATNVHARKLRARKPGGSKHPG